MKATTFPPLVTRLIPSLGRDNDNEVVATVRAIASALKAGGMDFHDVARALDGGEAGPACWSQPSASYAASRAAKCAPSFGDMARGCRDLDRGRLTLRERAFVADMVKRGFGFRPSPRQEQWLGNIFDRLNAGRAAA